jgi:hypothetical protein
VRDGGGRPLGALGSKLLPLYGPPPDATRRESVIKGQGTRARVVRTERVGQHRLGLAGERINGHVQVRFNRLRTPTTSAYGRHVSCLFVCLLLSLCVCVRVYVCMHVSVCVYV